MCMLFYSVCLIFTILSKDAQCARVAGPKPEIDSPDSHQHLSIGLKGVNGEKVQTALKFEITTEDGNTGKCHDYYGNMIDTRVPNEVKGLEGRSGEEAQIASNGITIEDGNLAGEEVQIATKYGIITEEGNPSGEDVQIATKFGITTKDGNAEIRDSPQHVKEAYRRKCMLLFGCTGHRTDTQVPSEITGFEGLTGEAQIVSVYEIATMCWITTENGNPSGEDVQIATKFGITTKDRNTDILCLRRLLYGDSCHRTDTQVPSEITGLEGRSGEEAQIATNGITIEDGNLAGEEVQIATKYGITVKDGHPSVIAPNMPPLLPTTAKKINHHELCGRKLLSLPASPETERNTPPLPTTPELPPSPPSPPSSHTVFTQELAPPPVPGPPSCFPKC